MGETRKWVKRLVVLVVVAWLKTRWWRGKAARIQRGDPACCGVFQPPAAGRACSRLLLGCRGSEARLRCGVFVGGWAASVCEKKRSPWLLLRARRNAAPGCCCVREETAAAAGGRDCWRHSKGKGERKRRGRKEKGERRLALVIRVSWAFYTRCYYHYCLLLLLLLLLLYLFIYLFIFHLDLFSYETQLRDSPSRAHTF